MIELQSSGEPPSAWEQQIQAAVQDNVQLLGALDTAETERYVLCLLHQLILLLTAGILLYVVQEPLDRAGSSAGTALARGGAVGFRGGGSRRSTGAGTVQISG